MSKSLQFCKQIASDPSRSRYSDRDWNNAKEFDSTFIFDQFLHGCREWRIEEKDGNENLINISYAMAIEPDADFEYFSSFSSIHDGTLLFVRECADNCAYKIVAGETYDNRIGCPKDGDTVHFTVGNLVVLNEYDMYGTKFAPKDRLWLHQRTTVLIPIKMRIEEH